MKFEIKSRFSGEVKFSLETESFRLCVEAAVKNGANLRGANLYGADADDKLTLVGSRPVLQLGPLGSRSDTLLVFLTDKGVWLKAGCFWGTRVQFEEALNNTHKDGPYREEYLSALALIDVWARKYNHELVKSLREIGEYLHDRI